MKLTVKFNRTDPVLQRSTLAIDTKLNAKVETKKIKFFFFSASKTAAN